MPAGPRAQDSLLPERFAAACRPKLLRLAVAKQQDFFIFFARVFRSLEIGTHAVLRPPVIHAASFKLRGMVIRLGPDKASQQVGQAAARG